MTARAYRTLKPLGRNVNLSLGTKAIETFLVLCYYIIILYY